MLTLKFTKSDLTLHERSGVMYVRNEEAPPGAKWAWMILGGSLLARAESAITRDRVRQISLQFHGGRQCWMVENCLTSPRTIYPRDDHYGSLPEMMEKFEVITGLKLPAVKLSILGQGICRVDAQGEKWDAGNPWELVPGSVYLTVNPSSGREKLYEAVEARGLMGQACKVAVRFWSESAGGWSETFDPSLVFSGEAWERIRKVGPEPVADQAVAFERQRVS